MSRPWFTEDQRTYGEWVKAHPEDTKYTKEIKRKHRYFPDKSLNQLRKTRISEYELSNRAWDSLSAQDKRDRNLSLQVLREMRKGGSLTQSLEKLGLRTEFVLKHLGKYLSQSGRTWKVTKYDRIQAEMLIYSTEGQKTIITASSKDRALIGEYFVSVQKAIKNNDPSVLAKFKDIQVVDAKGKIHHFETDLQVLHEIMEAQEEPEFLEVYQH